MKLSSNWNGLCVAFCHSLARKCSKTVNPRVCIFIICVKVNEVLHHVSTATIIYIIKSHVIIKSKIHSPDAMWTFFWMSAKCLPFVVPTNARGCLFFPRTRPRGIGTRRPHGSAAAVWCFQPARGAHHWRVANRLPGTHVTCMLPKKNK